MYQKTWIFVLFLTITVSQSSPIDGSNLAEDPIDIIKHINDGLNDLNLETNQKNLIEILFDVILRHQNSSLDQLKVKLVEADQNLENTIDIINKELNNEIVRIEENNIVVNADNLIDTLIDTLRKTLLSRYAESPNLSNIIEEVLLHLEQSRSKLKEEIENRKISVDTARKALKSLNQNIETNNVGVGIQQANVFSGILNDLVIGLIRNQFVHILKPIQDTIRGILTKIIDFNASLYTDVAPENDVLLIFAFAKNIVVRRIVNILVVIRTTIDEIFNNILGTTDNLSRKRREIDVNVDAEPGTEVEVVANGVFDVIFNPILGILKVITSPLNGIIKNTMNGVLEKIYPVLGRLILSPLVNLIYSIIDFILPTN